MYKPSRIILVPQNSNVVNPGCGPVFPVQFCLNPAFVLAKMELERSACLQQFIRDEYLVPSMEEEIKRMNIVSNLKELVSCWVKRVAYQRRLSESQIQAASATIVTFGSYGLGVHNEESDVDALCVGPWFASIGDFFLVLHNMLASTPDVSEIHCIKDAKVPLIRFKFDGISVDLAYAQLQVPSVPEDVDILNPYFLKGIDETSWKSLSGVRANSSILQLVPDVKTFQELLRCIKLWAKRRGLYGNLFGFFGGVHLAVLTAYICQRHANASLAALLAIFFKTFVFWPWPNPVLLQDGIKPFETRCLMPIQLPSSPQEYCQSNITDSTFSKIRSELRRGFRLTQDLMNTHVDWRVLFEHFPYGKTYPWFLKIFLSASKQEDLGDWVGWIKSRFRSLLIKLEEEVQGQWDPNPSEYIDPDIPEPHVIFLWGLIPVRLDSANVHSVSVDFGMSIRTAYRGPVGMMGLMVVEAAEVQKLLQPPRTKAYWRTVTRNRQMVPVYSNHLPHYVIGYLPTNLNLSFPRAGY